MPLTNDMLVLERPHMLDPLSSDYVQRIYKLPNGYGLSLVNAPILHHYPYAWEAAVLGRDGNLHYGTPLTSSVEVFMSDDQANAFIERAKQWAMEDADGQE